MIALIHAARDAADGLVINPAGWTYRSIPVLDAVKMFDAPNIEIHISKVHARDPIYHDRLVSPFATALMAGPGAKGYPVAVKALQHLSG